MFSRRPKRIGALLAASLMLVLQGACGGGSGTTSVVSVPVTLQSIAVSPSTAKAPAGATLPLIATGTYTDNSSKDLTSQATWSSSDPQVGIVSNAPGSRGVATAVGAGSATIAATFGNTSGSTTLSVTPKAPEWSWMGGASTVNAAGTYGVRGLAAAGNVPGSRQGAAAWTDPSGHLWLFGGSGVDANGANDYLNDLWRYDPTAGTWTWISGADTVDAVPIDGPGARANAVAWSDAAGGLWLFGGFGYGYDGGTGHLGDLWRFDTTTATWASVGATRARNTSGIYGVRGAAAAANRPGARYLATAWTDDSGNFWLFGGYGYDSGTTAATLADLWSFNPATQHWTWVGGSSINDTPSVYGSLGVPTSGAVPGARYLTTAWNDGNGHFWLMGGYGPDANQRFGFLDDFWMYTPSQDQWVWQAGSNLAPTAGVYATAGLAGAAMSPGGRESALSCRDVSGKLRLFGGQGYDAAGQFGGLNDLWAYDVSSGRWTWSAGADHADAAGAYGTLGTANSANTPGARYGAISWTDSSGHCWIFGGFGTDAAGNAGALNDLWRY